MTDPHAASSSAAPTSAPPSDTPVRILVVDDEETIRLALGRFLRARGYEVHAVPSGQAALDAITPGAYALMLCDVRMPGLSGLDVVPQARALDADLAIVMLSAVNDAPTARNAMTQGAVDYLVKPVELAVLLQSVERALHRRALLVGQQVVERTIREEVEQRTRELEREKAALRDVSVQVAEALVTAMEAKDVTFRGASARVADLASSIAVQLGLDEDTIEDVRLAGRLHDVGKIGISDVVLGKPSALSPEEYAQVKEHVRIGLDILAPLKHLGSVLRYVADHHERWDGRGYPSGLSGEDISVGGRILAAADAYEAVTSTRTYREAMPPERAIAHLATLSGSLLDPIVFDALRTVVERGRTLTFIE
jgi:response regulator RpfG family c-di-GMP phosphodiesterase